MATYKPLQSVALTANTSSVTFSNIDQNYTDLVIVANVATSVAGAQNVMRFNGSTGNYSTTEIYGTGSAISSYRFTGQSYLWFSSGVGIGSTLGQSSFTAHLNNYANSTANKTTMMRLSSNSGTYPGTVLAVGMWSNTSPITSVTLFADTGSTTWLAGSTFDLYGIKSGAPQALGGDLVTTDGNYWYHTFRSTQSFIPQKALTVEYLVIAGGGGGGYGYGGGGGAGGYRNSVSGETTGGGGSNESALALSPIAYTVTVGAGGPGKDLTAGYGTNGSNSVLSTITSTGGGGGGYISGGTGLAGLTGGSGGGGGGDAVDTARTNGGARVTTPIQGFAGGGAWYNGGGGGGAGATPATVQSTSGGGNGLSSSITGSAVTRGGGGAGNAGTGGTGGGGNGGSSGTANTGGGGGGTAGNGGSGIVIVRYPV
jgi:hypothetical protein